MVALVGRISVAYPAEAAQGKRLLRVLDAVPDAETVLLELRSFAALLARSPDDRFIVVLAHLNVLAESLLEDGASP